MRQAELLGISRGSVYCLPRPVSDADLAFMRRIDELHLVHPFMGAHMLRDQLERQGLRAGGRHIATLMRRMGIEALAPQPDTRSPSSITAHIRFVHHFFEDQDGVVTKFLTGFGAKLMTPLATNSSNRAAVTPVTLVNTSNVC